MAAAAGAKYLKEDGGIDDDRRESGKVRTQAARQCVKQIRQYAVLSAEWFALVDSLEQLARLAQLEALMPSSSKVSEIKGRAEGAGTLWDQETSEDAVRILVEEAKVNLCMRMLNEFKQWQSNVTARRAAIQQVLEHGDFDDYQIERKMTQFEEALGLLLLRGFTHVETMQLTDIPLVIEHCTMVLANIGGDVIAATENMKLQETVVIYYFAYLMKHCDQLNTGELLHRTKESNLIDMVLTHCLTCVAQVPEYPPEILTAATEGLKCLADNEDFQTIWEDFFPTQERKATFLEFDEQVVQVILKTCPEKRSELRPLTDFTNRMKRSMRK